MKSWKLKQFIYIFQRRNCQTFNTRWNNHLLTLINYKWSPHYTWKKIIWSIWIHTGKLVPGRSVAAKRKPFLEHFLHLKTGSWPEIQSDSGVRLGWKPLKTCTVLLHQCSEPNQILRGDLLNFQKAFSKYALHLSKLRNCVISVNFFQKNPSEKSIYVKRSTQEKKRRTISDRSRSFSLNKTYTSTHRCEKTIKSV